MAVYPAGEIDRSRKRRHSQSVPNPRFGAGEMEGVWLPVIFSYTRDSSNGLSLRRPCAPLVLSGYHGNIQREARMPRWIAREMAPGGDMAWPGN